MPNPLILAVEKIRVISDPRSRRRCAEALAASLRFDSSEHNPPQVMNADEIGAEFGFDNTEQDYYCIVLRRREIRDFARSYGKVLKSADITRLFKAEAYEAYFGKPIPKLASRTKQSATVYTYAEILHRAEIGNVDLPDEVNQLFRELDIYFDFDTKAFAQLTVDTKAFVQLTIESSFESFTSEDSKKIINRIKDYLRSNEVAIVHIEPGSVKISLILDNIELAENLLRAIRRGDFSDLQIRDAKKLSKAAVDAIIRYKEINGIYDVFLCHNSEDKLAVKTVAEKLRKNGIRPWLDEWDLRPGKLWQNELESQITSIRSAAVFVGQNGTGPWQNMEISAFITQLVNRGCPVIPVVLNGCTELPERPLLLREIMWVDFRRHPPNPIDNLIWGITGERVSLT